MADDIRKIYGDARFVLRKDTLENWQTKNPVLLEGEPSYVTDGEADKKVKFGDGVTPWNDLDYFSAAADVEVDQTYNPESKNAQSGIAVAEGIGKEIQGKISVWQKNTEYKVGDVVIAVLQDFNTVTSSGFGDGYMTVVAKCKEEHTSNNDYPYIQYLGESTYWEILQETNALNDALGNCIHNTYATKEEVGNIETALDNIIAIQNQLIGGDA
jgi:hypothetical protein